MMEPGIRQQEGRKLDARGAPERQEKEQQDADQGQRHEHVGGTLEHGAHQVDVQILMGSGETQLGMMDFAIVTVDRDQRFSAIEAEMQVISDQPQRQERKACDQRDEQAEATDGKHEPRLTEAVA